MWVFKYLKCLVAGHFWLGSSAHYCLRCGKTEAVLEDVRGFAGNEMGLVVEKGAVVD